MSNVLIGIIGVILFIGLALAGALFLGPRFQEATINSKTAAVEQSLSQVTHAANLYRVQEGTDLLASNYSSNVQTLKDAGYLKTVVGSPLNGSAIFTVDASGGGAAVPINHAYLALGPSTDTVARAICIQIERQAGSPDPVAAMEPVTTYAGWGARIAARKGPGCMNYTLGAGYSAYMPI